MIPRRPEPDAPLFQPPATIDHRPRKGGINYADTAAGMGIDPFKRKDHPRAVQIARAEANAGPTWKDEAERIALSYAKGCESFTSPELTAFAAPMLPDAPHGAWGSVLLTLAAKGLIRKCGTGKRPNGNPCPVWQIVPQPGDSR